MAYNFGTINITAYSKAKQWLKGGYGVLQGGKPPVDDAVDNNYQNYSDSITGLGAVPAFKALNASNQFEVNCGHAVIDNALTIAAMAAPATPTAVVNGTAGGTTYTYLIVGRAGSLQAKSATVSKTTGNATLSATNSITLTWAITPGYLVYDIYRTVGGATQGMIGTAAFSLGPNVATPTLSFTDTGLKGDSTTAPSANSTGAQVGDLNVYGNVTVNSLATPATPLVATQGVAGAATWTYKIVARSAVGSHTAASAGGSTTTGNATLTASNSNLITWQPVPGALIYDVYRTAVGTGPTTTGLIGTTQGRTFTDTGLAGDSTTAPSTNNTGQLSPLTPSSNTGIVPIQVAHAKYDFAVDGGGAPGLITPAANATIPANSIIYSQIINWTTPGVGVSNTTSIGTTGTGGGAAILLAATAVGSLTGIVQGLIVPQTASGFKKLTTAGTITLTTATAALTAGVCDIWVYYVTAGA